MENLGEYIRSKNYTVTGPAFEIYHLDGVVEVQIPVTKQ